LRNDYSETPNSFASCGIDRSLLRNRRTASALNSDEYGGVFGIDQHPSRPARWHSRQISTKPGEFQTSTAVICERTTASVSAGRLFAGHERLLTGGSAV